MSDQTKQAESPDPRVEAALREYLERVDRGDSVNREEFISQHADVAAALRSFFAAEEPFRHMAATRISTESAGISTRGIAAQGQETVSPKLRAGRLTEAAGSGLAGQFGRYQIIRALGKGAMGAVYLALDTQLKRKVAIKTPHFEDDASGEILKRFYREAEAAATLLNANICPVYDVGQIDGKHFISMAYIEGKPLSDLIHGRKTQSERQIVGAVHKLARALQQAHDRGIVHRDLKPANIMVNKQGEPIIMDFGLARKRRAEGEASLTQSGMILGSPAYMSPEQIDGDPDSVGPASDQYSLGVVLYEMLTGQLPFRGAVVNVLAQIITKSPTAPSELRPGLDPRIEVVCLRMMAKKPSDRFVSMKAVAEELATIVKNPAAPSIAAEESTTASRATAGSRASSADATASQIGQSVNQRSLSQRSLSPGDVTSIEELVRKCLRRRDYDQMIQIIERIPEDRRNDALGALLEEAREKVDEIAFLICEIDEADRLGDRQTALKKADELLNLKPGHHRATAIQEKYSGYGSGGAAWIGPLSQFTRPWSKGDRIFWSVLGCGLAVLAGMYGVIVISLGNKTAIVIDARDPGITFEVNDRQVTIKVPGEQSIQVEPGNQSVKVSYAGLETIAKSFTLANGKTKRLTVRLLDNKLLADLEGEIPPTIAGTGNKNVGTAPAEPKGPSPRLVAAAPPVSSASPPQQSDGFVPLFNGKDLTGWKTNPNQPDNWRVEDGILTGSGQRVSDLFTTREDFKDFHLRVEARINDGGNSGVFFRVQPNSAGRYEAQINSTHRDPNKTGSLYPQANKIIVPYRDSLVPPGDWFNMDVMAVKNHIVITVNGITTVDYYDSDRHFFAGAIGLQLHNPQTVVEFRKIEIKELSGVETRRSSPPAGQIISSVPPSTAAETGAKGSAPPGDAATAASGEDRNTQAANFAAALWALNLNGSIELMPDSGGSPVQFFAFNGSVATPDENTASRGVTTIAELGQSPCWQRAFTLRHVDLWGRRKVNDASLKGLRDLKGLESLNLAHTAVSDAGLEHLRGLIGLKTLRLNNTSVTRAGVRRLQEDLPACKISLEPAISYQKLEAGQWTPVMNTADAINAHPEIKSANGTLHLDGNKVIFPGWRGRDMAIRGRVKKLPGQNLGLGVRSRPAEHVGYGVWFNGGNWFGIGQTVPKPPRWVNIREVRTAIEYPDFFELTLAALDDTVAAFVDGQQIIECSDPRPIDGDVSFGTHQGAALFEQIEVQRLR